FESGNYPWKIEGQPGQASTDPGAIVAQGSRTVTSTDKDCFYAYTVNDDDAGTYSVTFDIDKHDNYSVDKDAASVSVSIGTCSPNSPTTPVTLTIMGAILTINDENYSSTVVIYLPSGVYPYSWVAKTGYEGSGNGSITINECTPPDATASISIGACSFTAGTGSLTSVSITLDNASLTINSDTYTSSTTIDLSPGVYTYTWVALTGYQGSGSGTLVIGGCMPKQAEATVSTGSCAYTINDGSLTPVTLTLFGAELTIDGITYFQSTVISLGPGIYPYTWTGLDGYTGSGSGSITIFSCEPKVLNEVDLTLGACVWTEPTDSLTPVTLTIIGASLTITDAAFSGYGPYTTSQIIQLPPGEYTYSFVPLEGYEGEGEGSFTIGSCVPGFASVSFAIGSCGYETAQGSLTQVRITLFSATIAIDGTTYPETTRLVTPQEVVIYLGPGLYPYTWDAIDGFEGSGSGELLIGDCTPKQPPTPPYSPPTGSNDNPMVYALIGTFSLLISVASLYFWRKCQKELN
ncbi:MAG: hypothetical protein MUO40_05080, partial [Anaerolineaceae bacterium]|nr:hypothetical protein [Anaerolineaceae bacterium]